MDCALGSFSHGHMKVVAPFELKGADTPDLDAIMPGRHKSPVQQAWEYANDTPGCRFVLVSNMVELRLYAVGHGRQAYETWDILDLVNPAEYARLQLLLGAEQLLNGHTAGLLEQSSGADKEITRQLYRDYRQLRVNLIISLSQSNPRLPLASAIEHAQSILDRILFIAFAEDRELLPPKTLENAFSAADPYNPRPIWENFKGLFRAIDKGSTALSIPAYNGGLFAPNRALDALNVSDDICRQFKQLGEYDFVSEVSVTVLGHIFEQSIADLEELRVAADEGTFALKAKEHIDRGAASSVKGRRKDEGVVYTPDHVTSFIVEQALGGYLKCKFNELLNEYVADPAAPIDAHGQIRWKPLAKEDPRRDQLPRTGRGRNASYKGDVLSRAYEYLFWRAWLDFLGTVKVVDPSCGSGAFLVAAFDWLHAEYRRVTEQLHSITGSYDLFDLNKEILNSNLYGVDLNAESVEITKLSLWLKTAERGKPLASLEANIHHGNSLIGDPKYTDRPFDWRSAFPEAFREGGFDVVLGNPPYVRMERIKAVKPYLKATFQVAAERADLYAYFYELGVRTLLKPGGRLGYISSGSFLKTESGERLRHFLRTQARLLTLIDFGDLQIFEGVTTYPIVVVAEKTEPAENAHDIAFLVLEQAPVSLSSTYQLEARAMPSSQLGDGSWQLESPEMASLRRRFKAGHRLLKEIYGSPVYGIKTGLNDAFVIDAKTRRALVAKDHRSAELLKPFVIGDDLDKWHIEAEERWLIYTPKNKVAIDQYPAVRDHLSAFRNRPEHKKDLERRATKQAWFELQQGAVGESGIFDQPKLIYPEISQGPKFSIDESGAYLNKTVFSIPGGDWRLLGLLNSRAAWFYFLGEASALRGGSWRLLMQQVYLDSFPIPGVQEGEQLSELARKCQRSSEKRRDVIAEFRRRIPDLAPGRVAPPLPPKLRSWWRGDFRSFRREVKKCFKSDIPLAERNDWESYFERARNEVQVLNQEITQTEQHIDRAVYSLFGLTQQEIALLESALGHAQGEEELS